MSQLKLYVCENFAPDFYRAAEQESMSNVEVIAYPSLCNNKANAVKLQTMIPETVSNGDRNVFFCSRCCEACAILQDAQSIQVRSLATCFSFFGNDAMINYITQKGGYLIGSGWLSDWQHIIRQAGFDQPTAKRFYEEMCSELVYFETGANPNADKQLKELSAFLDLPYFSIPYDPETIRLLVTTEWLQWQVQEIQDENSDTVAQYQSQCAEYSAVLDLINKVAATTNRREMFERVKNIFVVVFGANNFKYWSVENSAQSLPEDIRELLSSTEKSYTLQSEENRICIVVKSKDKVYGVIEVSDFKFPHYLDRYLNFAIEVTKVCGLVLANIEQYEQLLSSEKNLQYLSFHDAPTGLYNRTYINEMLNQNEGTVNLTVFMFDIDGLKQVNDQYGHAEGDNLIKTAADLLARFFRETDVLARIGGDEFIALVPNFSPILAKQCSVRITEAINAYNAALPKTAIYLGISIGFAISSKPNVSLEDLIKEADSKMYADKQSKRIKRDN